MRNFMLAVLLLVVAASAAQTPATPPASTHSIDDVYALTVTTNDDMNNRLAYQERILEEGLEHLEETFLERIEQMDLRMQDLERRQTQFIGERTNPLRINMLNIFFFVTCILYIMKKMGEEQLSAWGNQRPDTKQNIYPPLGKTKPKPQKNTWLSRRLKHE